MEKTDLRQELLLTPSPNHLLYQFCALVLFLALSSCAGNKKVLSKKADPLMAKTAIVWKIDRLGCDGNRSDDTAVQLAEEVMRFNWVKQEHVEAFLGPAESSHTRNGGKVLGYYYDADCVEGQIPEGQVFCILEFFFDSQTGLLDRARPICG